MSNLTQARSHVRHRRGNDTVLRRSVIIFPIIAALTMLWVLASPLMSIPDEPAHTIKAVSVAHGQLTGERGENQSDLTIVSVPEYVVGVHQRSCTAFNPATTADCALPLNADARDLVQAATSAGNYNPLYYAVVGLPSHLLSGTPAIYAMRTVSALGCALFLSVAIGAATSLRRSFWPTAAVVAAITPMVLYLSAGINPNALEIVATAALFLNICYVFENHKNLRHSRFSMLAVGISGAVLANTRALSLLWLAIAVLVAVLLYGFSRLVAVLKDRFGFAMVILAALGCAGSLGWLMVANSFDSLLGTPTTISYGQAFSSMLDKTFFYSQGYVGVMGWLDTPLPGAIHAFWNFVFAAIILTGLSVRRTQSRIAVIFTLVSVIFLPAFLTASTVAEIGYIWQGRYLLALFVLFLLVCGVAFRLSPTPSGPRAQAMAKWLIAGAVGVHFYAFLYVLRRYTVGLNDTSNWLEMFDPLWQAPLTWQFLSLAYLAVLTLGGVMLYRTQFPPIVKLAAR